MYVPKCNVVVVPWHFASSDAYLFRKVAWDVLVGSMGVMLFVLIGVYL
jgi:hypothetical protein